MGGGWRENSIYPPPTTNHQPPVTPKDTAVKNMTDTQLSRITDKQLNRMLRRFYKQLQIADDPVIRESLKQLVSELTRRTTQEKGNSHDQAHV